MGQCARDKWSTPLADEQIKGEVRLPGSKQTDILYSSLVLHLADFDGTFNSPKSPKMNSSIYMVAIIILLSFITQSFSRPSLLPEPAASSEREGGHAAESLHSRSKQTYKKLKRQLFEKMRERRQTGDEEGANRAGNGAENHSSVNVGKASKNSYMLDLYEKLTHSTLKTKANSIKSLNYKRLPGSKKKEVI